MRTDFNPIYSNISSLGGFEGASAGKKTPENEAESTYRLQNREVAEDRNMLRAGNESRREDRYGITIRSRQGDVAEFSYNAMNAQKSAVNVFTQMVE